MVSPFRWSINEIFFKTLNAFFFSFFLTTKANISLCTTRPTIIIIGHSGDILIKGQRYLSLTRLPMKIGVASGNKDNTIYP